jgi:hypothetical protein
MVETGKEKRRKDTLQYERSTTTDISSPNIGTTGLKNTHGEQILRPLQGSAIKRAVSNRDNGEDYDGEKGQNKTYVQP